MNTPQKVIAWLTVASGCLITLFPPWDARWQRPQSFGYTILHTGMIDANKLLVELLVVASVGVVLVFSLKAKI